MSEMTLRQPLRQHRRQQQHLIGIVRPKRLLLARRPPLLDTSHRLDLDQPLLPLNRRRHRLLLDSTPTPRLGPRPDRAVTDPGS